MTLWLLLASTALAETWCASPLIAHEWGVTVLLPAGGVAEGPPRPSWLHRSDAHPGPASGAAVRTLPPDSGIRDLPVVHFYAVGMFSDSVPIGVEVGFANGEASSWFPAATARTTAAEAHSAAATASHVALKAARAQRQGAGDPFTGEGIDLGRDPAAQLHWDRLLLTPEAQRTPHPEVGVPWVAAARDVPDALWVHGPGEAERFLFYEAETTEVSALVIERGTSGQRDHFVLRNRSDWDVHDVVFVHDGRVWTAPRIPAGKTAGFLLRDPFAPQALQTWLQARWTDLGGLPEPDWSACSMMRDPAVPLVTATDHRMFAAELQVLWTAWGDRLLAAQTTRLMYREDPAALDAVLPLTIFTDMYHDPRMSRLGVVVVEDPALP